MTEAIHRVPKAKTRAQPPSSGLLQRKCTCGGTPGPTGECAECRRKRKFGLQPKLRVNTPGDRYEREADRIADRVIGGAMPAANPLPVTPLVQRSGGDGAMAVPSAVDAVLARPGRPLDGGTRRSMEQRFGHDFSRVRVHADAQAAASAAAVQAWAYTVGRDVVFGAGAYRPGTATGQRLIAHELVHTLQQGATDHAVQRQFIFPHQQGGGFKGLMERDRRQAMDVAQHIVGLVRLDLSANRVVFYTNSGQEFHGFVVDTDLQAGSYQLTPEPREQRWHIEGQGGGERFVISMLDIDPWQLPYGGKVQLEVGHGNTTPTAASMSLDERVERIRALIKGWTTGASETELIEILAQTPEEQAAALVDALESKKVGDRTLLTALDEDVHWQNNFILHETLSHLRLVAMGEAGAEALAEAPVMPWHDVMGFFETAAVFSAKAQPKGKIRVRYLGAVVGGLMTDERYQPEISQLPTALMTGGVEYDPDQVLVIHDYDQGRFVVVTASQLLGYQHLGVRNWLSNMATVATLATPMSAARTVGGKIAVAAFERVLPATVLLVKENRLNLAEWFPVWGPQMVRYADLVEQGIALYGITRFAISGWQLFQSWRKVRLSKRGPAPNAKAEQVARRFEQQADDLYDQAQAIKNAEASPGKLPADLDAAPGPPAASKAAPATPTGKPSTGTPPAAPVAAVDDTVRGLPQATQEALAEAPRAARVLKKCASPCYPSFATPSQIDELERLLEAAETSGISVNRANLTDFLRDQKSWSELDDAIAALQRDLQRKQGVLGEFGEAGAWVSGNRVLPAGRAATSKLRGQPGTASGGEALPDVTGQWFPEPAAGTAGAVDPRVAQIPGQVARKLRDMSFKNFDDFRETFWKMIVNDPVLGQGWSASNVGRMKKGLAPRVIPSEAVGRGSNAVYQLNHKQAIMNAGGIYDLDNIEVVTPAFHAQIGD